MSLTNGCVSLLQQGSLDPDPDSANILDPDPDSSESGSKTLVLTPERQQIGGLPTITKLEMLAGQTKNLFTGPVAGGPPLRYGPRRP